MENVTNQSEIIDPENNIIRPVINSNNTITDPNTDTVILDCVLQDNGDIKGHTQDNTKVLYKYNDNKFYYGIEIGKCNLINLRERTEDERLAIIAKANESKRANNERKRNLKEIAKALLEYSTGERQKKQTLGENYAETFGELETNGEVMLARMILGAMDGSFKCAEFVRDTAGEKPKNEVEVSADLITDADRALIEKLEKRTN
jgi:hypothetical protein